MVSGKLLDEYGERKSGRSVVCGMENKVDKNCNLNISNGERGIKKSYLKTLTSTSLENVVLKKLP
jgi:hypothetical protein